MKLVSTTQIIRKRYEVELWSGNARKIHYVEADYVNEQRVNFVLKDFYGNDVTSDRDLIHQLFEKSEFRVWNNK